MGGIWLWLDWRWQSSISFEMEEAWKERGQENDSVAHGTLALARSGPKITNAISGL